MKTRGFSLFEVIVYIAIVAVVMTAVLSILTRSVLNRVKAEAIYTVTEATRFAMERMVQDTRNATSIDIDNNQLTLIAADGTVRTYAVIADQLTVSTNGGTAVAMTPSSLTVTDFTLTDRTTIGSTVSAVELSLGLATDATVDPRPDYDAAWDLTTTVSLRL